MPRLSQSEVTDRLKRLPGWRRVGNAIERTWTFETFLEAVAFMNRVFALAEAANHHPDLTNHWATVRLRFTTHDEDGVTERDFRMAARVSRVA